MAAVALLHHPARIEHRVVHADGEADDHDELGDVGRERVDLADRAEQADRADDGGRAEHERDAGGDERAERDEQDDQHQAVGDEVRLLAVLGVLGGDLLGGRGVAELLDAHAGVELLGGGDGGERLVDELLDCSSVPGIVKFTTTERPSLETVLTRSAAMSGLLVVLVPDLGNLRRVVAREVPQDAVELGLLRGHGPAAE